MARHRHSGDILLYMQRVLGLMLVAILASFTVSSPSMSHLASPPAVRDFKAGPSRLSGVRCGRKCSILPVVRPRGRVLRLALPVWLALSALQLPPSTAAATAAATTGVAALGVPLSMFVALPVANAIIGATGIAGSSVAHMLLRKVDLSKAPKHAPRNDPKYPLPSWLDKSKLNWAVVGSAGSGKSTLVNSLRGMKAKSDGAAKVGVTETTMEPHSYTFPPGVLPIEFPNLDKIRLYDLPGAATANFPTHKYVSEMGLLHFDGVLIVTSGRFTEAEYNIMRACLEWAVPFYVVRNKIDIDIDNSDRDYDQPAEKTLEVVRSELCGKLDLNPDRLYLIAAGRYVTKKQMVYDFDRLVNQMMFDMSNARSQLDETLQEYVAEMFDLALCACPQEHQVHVMAAILSKWVYDPEEAVPLTKFAQVQVNGVEHHENDASVTVATACATFGQDKVLYVVFRGTSCLPDVLDWNLQHDYDRAQDPDKELFIHKGGAGTVWNLNYLSQEKFKQRLSQAIDIGVQRVVFVGHSLGGLYAMVCMYKIFMQWYPEELDSCSRRLLDTSTCVTFGAPMPFGCSGSGSQRVSSFKAFMYERAVNFIHANDPCPRAWSKVDMKMLVEIFAEREKAGLSLPGRLCAGPVIDHVVRREVKPRLGELEQMGADYQHWCKILHIDNGMVAEHDGWRQFDLSTHSLEDHDIIKYGMRLVEAYVPQLGDPAAME